MSRIESVVDVFEPEGELGYGAAFADSNGQVLKVCFGCSTEGYRGLRVGAIQPARRGSEPIELGSGRETELIALIQNYLDRSYTLVQQRTLAGRKSEDLGGPREIKAAYVVRMLEAFRQRSAMFRWLDANYSTDQQKALIDTPIEQVESDTDREALAAIQNLRMGFVPDHEKFYHGEFLIDYQFEECGRKPLQIESVGYYYDGGSIGVEIADSAGCLVEFCFDYGMNSVTRGGIYIGARHPSSRRAKLATVSEEKRVLKLVKTILDKSYPRGTQQKLLQWKDSKKLARNDEQAKILLHQLQRRGELW